MFVLRKRNLLIALATLVIGISAAAIWGVPKLLKRTTTVSSQVSAYLLDDRGDVNGLLLASGEQLHFEPQTGEAVASQIKVGDAVTASGHAGSQSKYGREIRVTQISANGRTIVEADPGPPRPHGPHGPREPRAREDFTSDVPPVATNRPATTPALPNDQNAASAPNANTVTPSREAFKVSGTIRVYLVNGHGDVDGLILSTGEQVRFGPRVGQLVTAAEQSPTTEISIEGEGVHNERGTVIRATLINIGSQTITLNH